MQNESFESTSQLVPKPHKKHKILITALILLFTTGGYFFGFTLGRAGLKFEPKEFKIINQKDFPKEVDYGQLWEAIEVVNNKFIEKKPTPEAYLYGAISGAVSAANDPYTTFFPPTQLESFKSDLKGSFDGIGAEIGKRDGSLVIIAPLDSSPAEKAGLLPQDIILEVDGQSATDWSVEEAVVKIRGKKGTKVTLKVYRQSKIQPFEVTIERDKIEIKSIKWEFKTLAENKKIGVVTISRFGEDTEELFVKAVNEILQNSVSGLVVDLRNNPGGYLDTSVQLASAWLPEGVVVVTEEKNRNEPFVYKSVGGNRLLNFNTVVLINGGSASASEILAGALRDHKKAVLIGEKSFGKGSVQELVELKGGGAVKVTVAKWVTPSGQHLNKEGLLPDIEIKLSEDDIKAGKDPQMEKAFEELIKK